MMKRQDNRFDELRLIASLLVLFGHAFALSGNAELDPLFQVLPFTRLGDVGVSVFFVLSGYLVAQSLQRNPDVVRFLWRRAVRIYPALWVVVLLCAAVLGPALTTVSVADYWKSSVTQDYFLNASAYWIRALLPGVFESNPWPAAVNGSLWSLPYELSCYLLLAGLALFPGQLRAKVLGCFLGFTGLWAWHLQTGAMPSRLVFIGFDVFHAKLGATFFLGAVISLYRPWLQPTLKSSALAMICIVLLDAGPLRTSLFQFAIPWLSVTLANSNRMLPQIPEKMGDWSYGMYLYGFPVQQTLAYLGLHQQGVVAYIFWSIAVTLPLAAASWYLLEKPTLSRLRR